MEKKDAKKSIYSRVFNSINFYVYKHWRICGTMTEDDIQPSFEKNGDVYVSACAILQFRCGCVQSHLNSITVNKSDLSFSAASRNKLLKITKVVIPMITLDKDL